MSKKSLTATVLEQAKTTTTRIKENYRFSGIGSRTSIINETNKNFLSCLRSGIKSLIIDIMNDGKVDLLTITFHYEDTDSSSILDSRYEKYTIVRNGEFIQIPIDNFLLDCSKVSSLLKISMVIITADEEKFETNSQRKQVTFSPVDHSDFNAYMFKMLSIYHAFVYELV